MKNNILILVLSFFPFNGLFAGSLDNDSILQSGKRSSTHFPNFVALQYAGNIGFLSSGFGYTNRRDKFQISLMYGYSPRKISGVPIHCVTLRNVFQIHKYKPDINHTLIPYVGIGLNLQIGGRSFLMQPDNMPDGYYDFPKSIHLIPSAGLKLRRHLDHRKLFHAVEFYSEVTTVDAYVYYMFLSNHIKPRQVVSLSLGMNILLKKS